MKTVLLIASALFFSFSLKAQDFIYEGPAQSEVRSFWMNATGLKKTGKIAEGVAMMEARLAATKQKDPAYKTADMETELAKWKAKLNTAPANNEEGKEASGTAPLAAPQRVVNINELTALTADAGYGGPGKMYAANYFRQAADAKKYISENSFNTALNKIEQMEKSISQLKTKDPSYNTGAMENELGNYKAVFETQKYNAASAHQASRNAEQNAGKADEMLRQLFESTHIGFSTGDEPVMPLRVQEYKNKTQAYLSLGSKGSSGQLDYMKKLVDHHIIETNKEIVLTDNLIAKGSGTNWAEITYYTIQYHLAYWDAAQKTFPGETEFADEYRKVAEFANKIGSIENMKAKGGAAEMEKIKNRKLPVTTVKDAKLEKVLTDGFNTKFGDKATALKVVLVQNGWTTLRNTVSGVVTGRERSAKLAYKGKDGKCYLLDDYIFIHEEYIGSSFTNTKAVFNGLFGSEMLCENIK